MRAFCCSAIFLLSCNHPVCLERAVPLSLGERSILPSLSVSANFPSCALLTRLLGFAGMTFQTADTAATAHHVNGTSAAQEEEEFVGCVLSFPSSSSSCLCVAAGRTRRACRGAGGGRLRSEKRGSAAKLIHAPDPSTVGLLPAGSTSLIVTPSS